MSRQLADRRLYGILDLGYVESRDVQKTCAAMLEGGVQILQLRAKHHAPTEILRLALDLAPLCRQANVPFILNDHPALVGEAGADGVHVGQDDTPVAEARALAGPLAIVGKSTHSLDQARAAADELPDYIGFGPLFATPTKPEYPAIGTDDIRKAHASVMLPIYCIGGIKLENLDGVLAAGAKRVVVVSGILQAADVAGYCRELRTRIDAAL